MTIKMFERVADIMHNMKGRLAGRVRIASLNANADTSAKQIKSTFPIRTGYESNSRDEKCV